ncbi:glycoside hydrolase family 88/105 protein [Jeotgalibaca caeni]|uniref:glycoside hydrolase family 88/105 protein n=1 Tax=Jeotgalibaca caeni TaxID=3028623 RepID=UPI00237D5205|nr:glycoside hydrolase family 88 protein [Jeotgalibaca caeni]MDE1549689.1 glycoside hydrolase family 88 protein [Jeotgalibaca caeni]
MDEFNFEPSAVRQTLDGIVKRTMKMDMTWDWECGVAYYGICRAYEYTREEAYLIELKERMDELISFGFPADWTVNKCAMGHSLLTLYEYTGDERYWQLVESKIDYLRNRALRFGDGVLQHTVSPNNDFPEQAWADTLFMAAFLMLRVGIKTKDEELIEDALNQYYWHIKFLQNPATGLFYHGYSHVAKTNLSGFYWGRANAWAAYTMSQVGARLPEAYLYPKYMDIQSSLWEQLSALKLLQTENGLWRTLLDDPESYEETSASAGIASALLASGNPLYRKYIQKAIPGLLASITEDGRVLNVSAGTAVMKDLAGYRTISKEWIHGWGQGLMLAFLAELLNTNSEVMNSENSSNR